jgi:hypothetical protein
MKAQHDDGAHNRRDGYEKAQKPPGPGRTSGRPPTPRKNAESCPSRQLRGSGACGDAAGDASAKPPLQSLQVTRRCPASTHPPRR